jgi:cell division protein ZapA
MEDDLLPVNVMLSGRSYRIRIRPEEEAQVRRAIKAADEKINELRRHYAGKDDQDFLAMCLLMYATDAATATGAADKNEEIDSLVSSIDKVLSKED